MDEACKETRINLETQKEFSQTLEVLDAACTGKKLDKIPKLLLFEMLSHYKVHSSLQGSKRGYLKP